MKFLKWLTSAAVLYFVAGIILIIVGQTDFLTYLLPKVIPPHSAVTSIVKTIGATLIGSGVFTTIIKSSAYSEVFSNILGKIIWSPEYIKRAAENERLLMWKMASKVLYDEKFPAISNEIEDIITSQYFPISHNFYLENVNLTMNISDHPENEDYWCQKEVTEFILKPADKKKTIQYTMDGNIDIPENGEDLTKITITELTVNGVDRTDCIQDVIKGQGLMTQSVQLELANYDEYKIVVRREKVVNKKKNPDKRLYAKHIWKRSKITLICDVGKVYQFAKMGTINDFTPGYEQINENVKITTWEYDGVILPHQGFLLLFK
ncbi:MAG: hypothetical protein J0H92_10785 [Sphingobacteriales bacterium]|nr:hypothetical protein [Sphingobacteriales bacterium]OJW32774.1 MAG: hypothetical protein BGO54_20680 [Sphingobacteriales bacterium 46-32]